MKHQHQKNKRDRLELVGTVVEAHRSAMFSVDVELSTGNNTVTMCTLCGKMKENYIRIVVGDMVKIEVSPYDTSKGRIMQRLKS